MSDNLIKKGLTKLEMKRKFVNLKMKSLNPTKILKEDEEVI